MIRKLQRCIKVDGCVYAPTSSYVGVRVIAHAFLLNKHSASLKVWVAKNQKSNADDPLSNMMEDVPPKRPRARQRIVTSALAATLYRTQVSCNYIDRNC